MLISAKIPSICGPFEEHVLSANLLSCWVKRYKNVAMWWHGYWLESK